MATTNPVRRAAQRLGTWVLPVLVLGAVLTCPVEAQAETITYLPYRCTDSQAGMEAFHLLVPKGWQASCAVTWSANPALPAEARFNARDPATGAEFSVFPTQSYFWTNNRTFLGTNPPGTLRFGTRVAAPIAVRTALDGFVARERRGVAGLIVSSEAAVPELAQLARGKPDPGVRTSADARKLRIRYTEAGKAMEEEVYAAVSHFVIDMPGSAFSPGYFIEYWYVDHVFSFRATQGRLDGQQKNFQTMLYSLSVNPRWLAKVAHVKEALAQQAIRGVQAVGRMGELVARAGSEARQEQLRDWERRQEVQDRIARNFSDNIRGVDRYHDARAGKEVELPSGYGMAWSTLNGEYVVTDDPSFNPNVGSNLHWEPLERVK
jgi:hypothetical protein